MTISVIRTSTQWYVERAGRAYPVDTDAATTAALLADRPAVEKARGLTDGVPVDELDLRSPVTTPCRVVAQMVNYRSHARDSGFDPDRVQPTFFRKASGSVTGPHDPVTRPAHVTLLDYEVELGLVLGAPLTVGATVTDADLPGLVAGLVVTNDLSARDVQLRKGQFYESKSYPGFTPVGPRLVLLEPGDLAHLTSLRLQLSVDGVLRQDRTVADMIHGPARALTELARFQALSPGDLLLTGTPGGTALKSPPAVVAKIGALLPDDVRWRVFFRRQGADPHYLRPGNVITARIATDDGALDLGAQRTTIAAP